MMPFWGPLPDALMVGGVRYQIRTDFRLWVNLPNMTDYRALFVERDPSYKGYFSAEAIRAIEGFYTGGAAEAESRERLLDFTEDSGRIYASFLQAYGIDLYHADLHWHQFLQLLQNLPEWTTLSKVISVRAYDGDDEDMLRLQDDFALERQLTSEEEEAKRLFEETFNG